MPPQSRGALPLAVLALSAPLFLPNLAQAGDASCEGLAGIKTDGIEVTSATSIRPAPSWSPPPDLGKPAPVHRPFCRVEGRIDGRIGFEAWLPTAQDWNGRLLGAGVGGDAGVFNYADMARGIDAGYATATTDGGHKVAETHWMMRLDAVMDYTHRAQHRLNQTARKLVAAWYGQGPHHAYFIGCSGGGRQAYKEMQRFPQDYDGVIAGAGAPRMPEMSVRHLWQGLYQQRNPEGQLSTDDWALVAKSAVKACDANDGAVDGVVENPAACRFDPATLPLAAAKVRTVQTFYSPLKDASGRALDHGLLPGVTTRPGPPSPLLLPFFGEGGHADEAWRPERFDIAKDLALVNRRMPEMRADDTNLQPFIARGGKAILYQGWLDPSVIASQTLDYHDAVRTRLGTARVDDFMRLYMVPGMLHCRGGDGVDQFGNAGSTQPIGPATSDLLTSLTDWVEKGTAPKSIIGSRLENGAVTRQHPLCPWPQQAKYLGGDVNAASSFRCEAPSRHIDGKHATGARWAIDVPEAWNGTLLLYARGYGSGPADQAPETAPRGMKDWLLSQGYALAASSYTGAGWALEEAPNDQIEVLDAFTREVGKPRRSIAWGNSMGGLVSVALAERHPQRFAGALPMCGSVSGSVGMLNTALDGAFAFRTLLAPDSELRLVNIDDDRVNGDRAKRVLDAAWPTPQGRARVLLAAALAQIPTWTDANSPEPAATDFEAQAEQIRKAFLMGVFVPRTDQEQRAKGLYSWNTGVDYGQQLTRSGLLPLVRDAYARAGLDLDKDLAQLAAAPRISAQPQSIAYMRSNYVPSGALRIPLLTLQTVGDGATVPGTHGGYERIVREAGRSERLGQLWLQGAGHCTATPAEVATALRALEDRIDTGRWHLAPESLTKLAPDAPGARRFTRYTPPELLRACGPKPGSCPGEPRL